MKELENIFEKLDGHFDVEEPTIGHFIRFEAKLHKGVKPRRSRAKFISLVSAAASIVLLIGIWLGTNISSQGMELAEVSTEMEDTQMYFAALIEKELTTIENERNSDTEEIINDALEQLNTLENQYQNLKIELNENSEDKRIIYAMISNFQQRIDLLQEVLFQIESVKQQKEQNNEIYV